MIHEIFAEVRIPSPMVFFEVFHLLALISLLMFTFEWYTVLKVSADKKGLPGELTNFTKN